MKTRKTIPSSLCAALLLIGLLVRPAYGQTAAPSTPAPETWTTLIAREGPWAQVLTGTVVPTAFADADLEALTAREWKRLRSELVNTLRAGRGVAWEEAAHQAIYLSFYYRDKINLERASEPLIESYILDRNEQHRIIALAALHAIGDHDAMGYLAQRVRLEGSPRVRRLTVAALADHYRIRDYYGHRVFTEPELIGPPAPPPPKDKNR